MNKEELEKEADNYAEKHAFRVPYDGSNKFYDDVDFKASKEGYLAGAEPREKQIEELEHKLEQTENDLADYQFNYPTIKELQKENVRLKEINTHTLSQLNLDNGELIIENEKLKKTVQEQQHKIDTLQGFLDRDVEFDNLQKENAELKKRNAELKGMYAHSAREAETYKQFLESKEKENADLKEEINKIAFARGNLEEENAELKEELKKWKDEWQEQVQKATDEGYARTLQTIQLTKAKEIIKIFLKYEICTLNIKDELADNIAKAKDFLKSEVGK